MTVTEVYTLTRNASNSSLVEYVQAGSNTVNPSVYNDSNVSCSNVLKEIAYTVNVSEVVETNPSATYLRVDSINALVVV